MAKSNGDIAYERASRADIPVLQRLLRECGLPWEDIGEHVDHFIVARQNGRAVGVVGMEHSGSTGVVRSLAVSSALRGSGIGKELYRLVVEHARGLGVKELGLLTTTAKGFFSKVGFTPCDDHSLPEYVTSTKEYRLYCPSTAVCMTKSLA